MTKNIEFTTKILTLFFSDNVIYKLVQIKSKPEINKDKLGVGLKKLIRASGGIGIRASLRN